MLNENTIGKPCEGKLHARFDEGGADGYILLIFRQVEPSGSTLCENTLLNGYKEFLERTPYCN